MPNKVTAFFSYGQGGQAIDIALGGGGIDRLAARVRALGVSVSVHGWDQYREIADKIKKVPTDTLIVVGGASLGANMAPWIGSAVGGRPIDFMFGIQPSNLGGKYSVTRNVRRALCVYNPIWFLVLGNYWWRMDAGNSQTRITYQTSYASHPGDNWDSVQNPILAEIKKLMT